MLDYSPVAGLNGNQQNVGNTLTNFFNSNGSIPILFGALTPAGLTQASGETATGAQQTTFNAMTQFLGALLDPFIGGRGDVSASATGAAPFAEEDDAASAYASRGHKRSRAERDAHGMMTKAAPRNGRRALAVRRPPMAMLSRDRTARPAASSAPPSARIISSRRAPLQASRSPVAAPVSVLPTAAADAPTCSRRAPSSGTPLAMPISPARWPMAGRTSRRTGR